MLNAITREKVEEVIRLWQQARNRPEQRSDDPAPSGPDPRGVAAAEVPEVPQPEPDWAHAFPRYLHDLSDPAIAELVALYRTARGGETPPFDESAPSDQGPFDQRRYLASLPDLGPALRRALDRL